MSKSDLPEKYTLASITTYLATANDVEKKTAKNFLESFLFMIEQGVLAGNRVPLGNLGKIYMHKKPATKERQGRNPATGQPITIQAKPPSQVLKFSFNKSFKEVLNKK